MKRQNTMLLAVAFVATVLTINAQAMPVTCPVSTSDQLAFGSCTRPLSPTTTRAATLKPSTCPCLSGGDCWKAVSDKAYTFSLATAIVHPLVGGTLDGGYFDQQSHDDTATHENWHYLYTVALVNATFGRLEAWSASYLGGCFHTEAAALATGNADLANALTVAQAAYTNDFFTDRDNFERKVGSPSYSYREIQDVGGVPTWRSVNPNWGAAAVAYANGVTVTFATTPGDCPCIPEPCTLLLLGSGVAGIIGFGRKRLFKKT